MAPKAKKKLGTVLDSVKVVERPDGSLHNVVGGLYVLDVEGTHVIDGEPVEAS